MSKRIKFGAGFYQARKNSAGTVYDYDARKQWIPQQYQKGSKNTIAEVKEHLLWLEKAFKNTDGRTGAEYFGREELDEAKKLYESYSEQYKDFANEQPSLALIVQAGLRQWTYSGSLRPSLRNQNCTVSDAIDLFLDGKKIRQQELRSHRKRLPLILSGYLHSSIYGLYEPFKMGDDPRKSVINVIQNNIKGLRRVTDGKKFSDNVYLKAAKLAQEFFKVTRTNYQIQYSNPVEGIVQKFAYKDTKRPQTADLKKVRALFKLLKENPRYQPLIPYAALYWYSGRRPSDAFKWVQGFGNAPLSYEFFDGFVEESTLFGDKGCKFWLPAERTNDEGVTINGTKATKEEVGELSETGLLWIRFYFNDLLKTDLPHDGEIYYSRDLWNQARKEAGWGCTQKEIDAGGADAWVNDLGRHTYNTALSLYKPQYLEMIRTLAGHSDSTFKKYYQNPRMPIRDAKEFMEGIRPDTL